VYLPVGEDQRPGVEAAAALLSSRTRAIVLVTPNNPTGVVCSPELIEAFFQLARDRGVALLVDETYRDFRTTTAPPHALFGYTDWDDTLIHLYSFSKVFALPGYRVGAIVAGASVLAEVEKWMDCVAICSPRVSQEAARFGLLHLGGWREARRSEMVTRLERFRGLLREHAPDWAIASAGAYFAYLRHPEEAVSAQQVARRLLEERGLLTLWGEMFGPGQQGFLRFALANLPTDELESVAQRLGSFG
jgi:aspartate/methionine/tyrosine aminotransferase